MSKFENCQDFIIFNRYWSMFLGFFADQCVCNLLNSVYTVHNVDRTARGDGHKFIGHSQTHQVPVSFTKW